MRRKTIIRLLSIMFLLVGYILLSFVHPLLPLGIIALSIGNEIWSIN